MNMRSGLSGVCGKASALPACLLVVYCVACSSASEQPGLLGQSPNCPEPSVLRVEGTINGKALSDSRTSNINAGLTNLGSPQFRTPFSSLASLERNQVGLDITWANSLADGDVAAITSGVLRAPADSPHVSSDGVYDISSYCVTQGEVGFVSGGPEAGVFKFVITELWNSSGSYFPLPCPTEPEVGTGEKVAVDVRGCFR